MFLEIFLLPLFVAGYNNYSYLGYNAAGVASGYQVGENSLKDSTLIHNVHQLTLSFVKIISAKIFCYGGTTNIY